VARHRDRADIDEPGVIDAVASDAGLDLDRFRRDLADESIVGALARDHTEAVSRFGVFGTPTFVFAGGPSAYVRLAESAADNGGDRTYAWKDFSGAMVRHAVDDAMRALPPEYMRVVKLAYFGGYSNREIALEVGLTEATVQRRLRRALGAISYHIQHGRAVGR